MNTVSHTKTTLDHLGREVSDKAQDAYSSVRKTLSTAGEHLADVSKDFGATATRSLKSSRKIMKRHPIATVAVGLAAGYLLVRLMRRRMS